MSRLILVGVTVLVIAMPSLAEARRRIVILDFEGPKAKQFHVDVERIVKKSHLVIPTSKWNAAAEEMDATSLSERDIKKVAKRLNVDGVISGKVEKRRDEYILRLKVREGTTGEVIGNPIDSKTGGPRLDGSSTREIKSELFDTLDILDTGGGGDDEEAAEDEDEPRQRRFVRRSKSSDDEEDEDSGKSSKGKKSKDDEPVAKSTKGKKSKDDDEDEEPVEVTKSTKGKKTDEPVEVTKSTKGKDDASAGKTELASASKKADKPDKVFVPKTKTKQTKTKTVKAKKKEVAIEDDDLEDSDDSEDSEDISVAGSYEPLDDGVALNHAHRAIDVNGGVSFTQRRLRYTSSGLTAPATPPRSYDSVPVAGFMVDGEVYPLAYGHKRRGVLTNIGLTGMFDRTFRIRTRLRYTDGAGQLREKELQSTYQRLAIGAIYRHNLGSAEKPLVVTGSLRFGNQKFTVDRGGLDALTVDIPGVSYTMLEPSVGIRYGLGRKMAVGAEVGTLLMTSTGDIQEMDSYGPATVTAFEGEGFFDYMITSKVFARASARIETIGMKFKGFGQLSNMRDADPDQEVKSARDTYFGGSLTAGYVF